MANRGIEYPSWGGSVGGYSQFHAVIFRWLWAVATTSVDGGAIAEDVLALVDDLVALGASDAPALQTYRAAVAYDEYAPTYWASPCLKHSSLLAYLSFRACFSTFENCCEVMPRKRPSSGFM